MRVSGKLTSWQDDRGFGFISLTQGGDEVFLHIKAFPRHSGRPQVGEVLTFETAPGPHGKKRAINVQRSGSSKASARPRSGAALHHRVSGLLGVAACLGVYWVADQVWGVPLPVALVCLAMGALSLLTFLVYGADKVAAQRGGTRVPEAVLHLLAVIGGWPGAALAQKMFHHKRSKPSFLKMFRGTVGLNLLALAALGALWYFEGPFT
ncbi:MAG: hypothetical protein RLZZ618_4083 [Pseudomonadota bacterium]|jgi:uncharacterized membrane protein YsdA (DUF1294 family)/cold shock CspA family protein